MATFEGQVLDALFTYAQNNEQAVLALIAQQNINVADFVETAATNAIAKNPVLQMIFGGVIKQIVPQLIAALGSEEKALYDLGLAALKTEAAKVGG